MFCIGNTEVHFIISIPFLFRFPSSFIVLLIVITPPTKHRKFETSDNVMAYGLRVWNCCLTPSELALIIKTLFKRLIHRERGSRNSPIKYIASIYRWKKLCKGYFHWRILCLLHLTRIYLQGLSIHHTISTRWIKEI